MPTATATRLVNEMGRTIDRDKAALEDMRKLAEA